MLPETQISVSCQQFQVSTSLRKYHQFSKIPIFIILNFNTGEGVDIIIGLGHSGYTKDKEIAAKVPHLDLVIGAHSHSFLYSKIENLPSIEHPKVADMARESKLRIYTQQRKINGFSQFLACKEQNKLLHWAAKSACRSLSSRIFFNKFPLEIA